MICIYRPCIFIFLSISQYLSESGTALSLEESARFLSFQELSELVQAMPGFLMLVSGEGKLLYLSDSVSEHLGHSMVRPNELLVLSAALLFHYFTNSVSHACAVWEFNGARFAFPLLQVDLVAQGDSVYDIIESSDHFVMKNNLTNISSPDQGKPTKICKRYIVFLSSVPAMPLM